MALHGVALADLARDFETAPDLYGATAGLDIQSLTPDEEGGPIPHRISGPYAKVVHWLSGHSGLSGEELRDVIEDIETFDDEDDDEA